MDDTTGTFDAGAVKAARAQDRPGHREARARAADQPFEYPLKRAFVEPDWTRLPGIGA